MSYYTKKKHFFKRFPEKRTRKIVGTLRIFFLKSLHFFAIGIKMKKKSHLI